MRHSSEIKSFIEMLNTHVELWKTNARLYCGGCVFSSAVIARELEKRNIPFNVITFTNKRHGIPTNSYDVNVIANHDDLTHVGIEIINGDEKTLIGGEGDYVTGWGAARTTLKMTSTELMDMYNTNRWNEIYDKRKNPIFQSLTENLFNAFEKKLVSQEMCV